MVKLRCSFSEGYGRCRMVRVCPSGLCYDPTCSPIMARASVDPGLGLDVVQTTVLSLLEVMGNSSSVVNSRGGYSSGRGTEKRKGAGGREGVMNAVGPGEKLEGWWRQDRWVELSGPMTKNLCGGGCF